MERFGLEPQVGTALLLVIGFGSMMLLTLFALLPVKMAAAMMGAKRTGFAFCAVALFCSYCIYALGFFEPFWGPIVAFFLNGIVFSVVLGTGFIRGMVISLLHGFFAAILAFGIGILLIALGY